MLAPLILSLVLGTAPFHSFVDQAFDSGLTQGSSAYWHQLEQSAEWFDFIFATQPELVDFAFDGGFARGERSYWYNLGPDNMEWHFILDVIGVPEHTYDPSRGAEQWSFLIAKYFTPEDRGWALRVMQCESGGNPDARRKGGTDSGLFQFLASTWKFWSVETMGLPADGVFDPELNVKAAAGLYYAYGPSQWVCK